MMGAIYACQPVYLSSLSFLVFKQLSTLEREECGGMYIFLMGWIESEVRVHMCGVVFIKRRLCECFLGWVGWWGFVHLFNFQGVACVYFNGAPSTARPQLHALDGVPSTARPQRRALNGARSTARPPRRILHGALSTARPPRRALHGAPFTARPPRRALPLNGRLRT